MKRIFSIFTLALIFMSACSHDPAEDVKPTPPEVEITEEMLSRSKELNVDLKTLFDLNRKPAASEVTAVEETGDVTRITFKDGQTISISVHSSISDAPLVGIMANESNQPCWAINLQGKSRILVDNSGKSYRIDEAYPVTSISRTGVWNVALQKSKMTLTDNEGKDLMATGEEASRLFKAVEKTEKEVKISLYEGKYLSFPRVQE